MLFEMVLVTLLKIVWHITKMGFVLLRIDPSFW